jgi:hypothetical protein
MFDFTGKANFEATSHEQAVKLLYTRDLANLSGIPRYQDYDGISLAEYIAKRKHLQTLRLKCKNLLEARRWLREHDHEELVDCDLVEVRVPHSLMRRKVSIEIPRSRFAESVPQSACGPVMNGYLTVKSGWCEQVVNIQYRCPSKVFYRDDIDKHARLIASSSSEELGCLQHIDSSPFSAPLLFISHRWQSTTHPDPNGDTLSRLQELGDAFLIFDYSSFPQEPLNSEYAANLKLILEQMNKLMHNVVVLYHAEYLQRGWCVYEYLSASLSGRLVCDEVGDKRFIELLRWIRTKSPPASNPWHDGFEAGTDNFIQESILRAVNELMPVVKSAQYTIVNDRSIVRALLRNMLKQRLPNKREHDPYLGESKPVPWTNNELDQAFESGLTWETLQTNSTDAFKVFVPTKLQAAAAQGFRVQVTPSVDYQNAVLFQSPFSKFAQVIAGAYVHDDFGRLPD